MVDRSSFMPLTALRNRHRFRNPARFPVAYLVRSRAMSTAMPHRLRSLPDADAAAFLFEYLVRAREIERGKSVVRLRLPDVTIRRLWGRERLSDAFLREVQI